MSSFFVFNGAVSTLEAHPDWKSVNIILKALTKAGYRALIAGGAVRDMILDREPNDIDIATSATPDQVEALFEKTVMVGRQFGVARIILEGRDIEVATFRKDGAYKNGRQPESIEFSSEEEDAKRRDFTINGLFFDPATQEVIDFVDGRKDIENKVIRAIGDPKLRFSEDKLRILRALRFHAQLGFTMDPSTESAIKDEAAHITQVSLERVRDEWQKLMLGPFAASAIRRTKECGLWNFVFPNWTFRGASYAKEWSPLPNHVDEAWALWFHRHSDSDSSWADKQGRRLKLSGEQLSKIGMYHRLHPLLLSLQEQDPVDLALALSETHAGFALDLFKRHEPVAKTEAWQKACEKVESYFQDGKLPKPLVGGEDLLRAGFKPGPAIAVKLKELHRKQLLKGVDNKEELLKKL